MCHRRRKPGQYRVCARAYGGAVGCSERFQVEPGPQTEIDLPLDPSGSILLVMPPEFDAGATLFLNLADGTDLTFLVMSSSAAVRAEDHARLGYFIPGRYLVTCRSPSWSRTLPATVRAGEETVLDLEE